jgi:hypothetical protein
MRKIWLRERERERERAKVEIFCFLSSSILMTFWERERERKRGGDKGGNVLLRYFFIDHFDYILTTF